MKFKFVAVLSVLALLFVWTTAAIADEKPYPFALDHPVGYPARLLSQGQHFRGVFKIGPDVERMPLTESWESAKLRKIADDESTFYLGKLRYVSYLNNLCGGTQCTVTANIQVIISQDRSQDRSFIVRLTLNGSSSYMEAYLCEGTDGAMRIYSRAESGWISKTNTEEAPLFLGITEAALHLGSRPENHVR